MIDTARRSLVITVVLTGAFIASVFEGGGFQTNAPMGWALLGLNTLPLLALHKNPLLVVLAFGMAYPLWVDGGYPSNIFQSLPALAALYATGSWSRPLWLRAIGLLTPGWMFAAAALDLWPGTDLLEIGYVAVIFAMAWALGVILSARRTYIWELEDKTKALEEARHQLAQRAVADERARIARELHDVIAHAMSVITVRAGVGAHLVEQRPTEAAEALGVIERTGREALSEMRRMLDVLRGLDQDAYPGEPQPGLDELPRLVEQVRQAGVNVTVNVEGEGGSLPPGLDLAAYRVIQEALTNVVKHSPRSRAEVMVRHLAEVLEVEVFNPGRVDGEVTPGQGIRGMEERVTLYGGHLDAEPCDNGFRVRAKFPLNLEKAQA